MRWSRIIGPTGLLVASIALSGCVLWAEPASTGTAALEVTASGTMPCSTIHSCTAFFVIRNEGWDGFWRAGPDEHAFETVPVDQSNMWSSRRVTGPAGGLPASLAPGHYVLGGAHADMSDFPGGGYFNDSVLCTSDLIVEPSATRVEISIVFREDLSCSIDIVHGAGRGIAQLHVSGSGKMTCAHPRPDSCSAFLLIRPAEWGGSWTADTWDGRFGTESSQSQGGVTEQTLTGGFSGPGSIKPGDYRFAGVRAEFVGSDFVEPAVLCSALMPVASSTARLTVSFAFADTTCEISVTEEPFPDQTAPSSPWPDCSCTFGPAPAVSWVSTTPAMALRRGGSPSSATGPGSRSARQRTL